MSRRSSSSSAAADRSFRIHKTHSGGSSTASAAVTIDRLVYDLGFATGDEGVWFISPDAKKQLRAYWNRQKQQDFSSLLLLSSKAVAQRLNSTQGTPAFHRMNSAPGKPLERMQILPTDIEKVSKRRAYFERLEDIGGIPWAELLDRRGVSVNVETGVWERITDTEGDGDGFEPGWHDANGSGSHTPLDREPSFTIPELIDKARGNPTGRTAAELQALQWLSSVASAQLSNLDISLLSDSMNAAQRVLSEVLSDARGSLALTDPDGKKSILEWTHLRHRLLRNLWDRSELASKTLTH